MLMNNEVIIVIKSKITYPSIETIDAEGSWDLANDFSFE